jgi:hypothetical protein
MREAIRTFVAGLLAGAIFVVLFVALPVVFAVAHTLTYTTGQDTAIQTVVIPIYNRKHCADFGLPAACTSAQLVTRGCVAKVVQTLTVDSCTIFTSNLAGQDLYLLEAANRAIINDYDKRAQFGAADFHAGFAAANQTNKDAACVAAGQPAGCPGP